jgi:hypothetical protein
MQLSYIFASLALVATTVSARPFDSQAEARAVVRSLLADYEEYMLATRAQCKVEGAECTGQIKQACGVLCNGSPCAFNKGYPNKEVLNVCLQKCRCTGSGGSSGGSAIKVDTKKKVKTR